MHTTPTFDALVAIAERRNEEIDRRDRYASTREDLPLAYQHTAGIVCGLGIALELLRTAGERVGSAEYVAIQNYRARHGVTVNNA